MKKLITILAAIAGVITCNSQTLSPKANPTSGGYYNAGGNSLSWTMGETYNTTLSSTNNKLTQGEQQPEGNLGGGCTTAPAAPVSISGPSAVCNVTTTIYSVTAVTGASGYTWTVPAGITINSGQNTTTLHVTISGGTIAGNITCSASNACGTSSVTSLAVAKKPGIPNTISGPTDVCGLTSATYFIMAVQGATSYTWTIPAGMTLTGGAGTTSVTVTIASTFTSGAVKVTAVNNCGSVPGASLAVYGKVPPTVLTGPANVCGMTTATYTCNTVTNAASYGWQVPATWTFTGQGTTTIIATMPANINNVTFSGIVRVHAINSCGQNSADKTLTVSYCKSAEDMTNGAGEENSFSVYPNPTSGEFRIMNYESGIKNIEMYDMLGKCVYKSDINNQKSKINISHLSNGIYFVKLTDKDDTIYTEKMVKQ